MVDRRPVRRRVAAVRPRRGPRLRQRGRGPLGCRDVLRRLAVLHVGWVSDLPGGRGRRPAGRIPPTGGSSSSSPAGSTGGPRRCSSPGPCSSTSAPERATGRPVRAGRAPARVAARCRRLGLLPGGQRAGLVRGLPRLDRLAPPVVVMVDHPGQPDRVGRLRRVRRGRLHQPGTGQLHNASGRTWALSSVRCASSPGRCCSCPNAPRKPAPVTTPVPPAPESPAACISPPACWTGRRGQAVGVRALNPHHASRGTNMTDQPDQELPPAQAQAAHHRGRCCAAWWSRRRWWFFTTCCRWTGRGTLTQRCAC